MKQVSKRVISFLLAALIIMDVFAPLNVSANNYEMNKRPVSKDLIIDEEGQSAPKTPGKNDLLIYQENEEKQQNQGIEENKERKENQRGPSAPIEEKKTIIPKEKPDPVKKDYIAWRLVDPGKTVYNKGEKLDLSNLLVEVTNSNGQTFHLGYNELINDKIISVKENIKSKSYLEPGSGTLTLSAPYLNDININIQVLDNKSNELSNELNEEEIFNSNDNSQEKNQNILEENNLQNNKEENLFEQELKDNLKEPNLAEKLLGEQEDKMDLGKVYRDIDERFNPMAGIFKSRNLTLEEEEIGLQIIEDFKEESKSSNEITDNQLGFQPFMFFMARGANESQTGVDSLKNKKFTIVTRFDASVANGTIPKGQFFTINLDPRLKVNNSSSLEPIRYNGEVIASPSYDSNTNTITYTLTKDIQNNIKVPLSIDVDYNVDKVKDLDGKDATKHSIKNSITGLGVTGIVNLPETIVDNNGNVINQIIEPGGRNVEHIIDQGKNYEVNMDASGIPVIIDKEMKAIDWTITFDGTVDMQTLGLIANATVVKGSGLGEIKDISLNGETSTAFTDNIIKGNLGIVDSKHYVLDHSSKRLVFKFRTDVTNVQSKYMIDFSVLLKERDNKFGAVRLLFDKGFADEIVKEETPSRVGMNNRTTILGEFTGENAARWTVTDGVCTGDDNKGLPLADRNLGGQQTLNSAKMAVYGLDLDKNSPNYGKMVVKQGENDPLSNLNSTTPPTIPTKGTNPSRKQNVGTIAVYEYKTNLTDSNAGYTLSGININKYQDLKINQEWNGLPAGANMPAQGFEVKDESGNSLGTYDVGEGNQGEITRTINLAGVKYWDIKEDTTDPTGTKVIANRINHKVEQKLPGPKDIGGKTYAFYENVNYYKKDTKEFIILNKAKEVTDQIPATFTVTKTDSSDDKIKLQGASFKLQSGTDEGIEVTTGPDGKATFSNIEPGVYDLIETKAPDGYKLDQSVKRINILSNGNVIASGDNITVEGGNKKTEEVIANNTYPDYMNAMHYGTIDNDGNIEFYIYLKSKAKEANATRGTDKDTRLNLDINNGTISSVEVFDVDPDNLLTTTRDRMNAQTMSKDYTAYGQDLINKPNKHRIIGRSNIIDSYTGKKGYQINLPKERFGYDQNNKTGGFWGFLVRVTGKTDDIANASASYDWLTEKDTANETKTQQTIGLGGKNENSQGKDTNIIIKNEAFAKSKVEITKIKEDKKTILSGVTFALKDQNGVTLYTKTSDGNGNVDFGELPEGKYVIEEIETPEGYQQSKVVFDVTVDATKKVTYKARFKNGNSKPIAGVDYIIENEEVKPEELTAKITSVTQAMILNEGDPKYNIGTKPGIWEAYRLEAYTYNAQISLKDVSEGTKLMIQFDPNLDLRKYVNEIPKIMSVGSNPKVIAEPYMDYETNRLTYVFNKDGAGQAVTANIKIVGITPSIYYAQNNGTYHFKNTVINPGGTNYEYPFDVTADYGYYNTKADTPAMAHNMTEPYIGKDGKMYMKVISYYNALAGPNKPIARNLLFDWLSGKRESNYAFAFRAQGRPAFELDDVKIYRVLPSYDKNNKLTNEMYMPLSFGVRPEQDPGSYELAYHKGNITGSVYESSNGFTLDYNANDINTSGSIGDKTPLMITVPPISKNKEGYVIVKKFEVTDKDKFRDLWRLFYYSTGSLHEGSYQKGNDSKSTADQTGQEIPKFTKQKIKLINRSYIPGEFNIKKLDETSGAALPDAKFELTELNNENSKKIYRTTDADGNIHFGNLRPGNYTLVETEAPKGFIKSDKIWQINVTSDGVVTIAETGLNASEESIVGKNITITAKNKPEGTDFRVYKKDDDGRLLKGAEFKLTNNTTKASKTATSDENGLVKFDKLADGLYILEETKAPTGYKSINKKWVVEVKNNQIKIYNHLGDGTSTGTTSQNPPEVDKSIFKNDDKWVDVAHRPLNGWNLYDNRWGGYVDNHRDPYKMGTRIVAINKTGKYVIQRYVINPEGNTVTLNNASIHKEKPEYQNMDWYSGTGDGDIKIFTLDKAVNGNVEDIRLENYTVTDITNTITKSNKVISGGNRLYLDFGEKQYNKPIIIDVKVPFKELDGGVGTGMDLSADGTIYWKSDYYEKVSDIVEGEALKPDTGGTGGTETNIKGSYVADGSLTVNNETEKHEFKLHKIKEGTTDAISGASFKLIGPKPKTDERYGKTDKDGNISFTDLPPGTYTLIETGPAQGYEKPQVDWVVNITKDGKTYIREAKWEKVDITSPNDGRKSETAGENQGNKNKTHITEINKDTNKFRQVYILNKGPERLDNPRLEIHSFPEERDLTKANTRVVSVQLVGPTSEPDNIVSPGAKVDYELTEEVIKGHSRQVIQTKNLTGENKTLAVVVESDLPQSGPFGTGLDFKGIALTHWGGESYKSLDKVIFSPASGGTSRSVEPLKAQKETPQDEISTFSMFFGPTSNEIPESLEMKFKSVELRMAKEFEISPELLGGAVRGANDWETVDPNSSSGRASVAHSDSYMETKVSEINKADDRFRQLFLFKPASNNFKGLIEIHRQPENQNEFRLNNGPNDIISTINFYEVDASSTIDNVTGKRPITINATQFIPTGNPPKPMRVKATLPAGKTILVEVETPYAADNKIGLGADYQYANKPGLYDNTKYKSWAADSYSNEDHVNDLKQTYTVTFDPNGGKGNMTSVVKNKGESYTLPTCTFTPPSGKVFDKWEVNGTMYNAGDAIPVNANTTVRATWKYAQAETVTITFDGNGGTGTMSSVTKNKGESYTLPANGFTAQSGKEFKAWEVGGQEKNPGENITVNADTTIKALWKDKAPDTFTITITQPTNGSVTADKQSAAANNTITLKVTPDANYELDSLTVKDANDQAVNVDMTNYTFTMPASNVTVTATFKPKQAGTYTVTVNQPTEGGTISAEPTSAAAGATINLTATPSQGFALDNFTVTAENGDTVTVTNNKFKMPASNVTVSATFKSTTQPQPGDYTPQADDIDITNNKTAQIKNKPSGLELKVLKKSSFDNPLQGAEFTLVKKTDATYNNDDRTFTKVTATSGRDGNVIFKDANGNTLKLEKGYYLLTETKAPTGFKPATAPWKIHVKEEGAKIYAEYEGPESTPSKFIEDNEKSNAGTNMDSSDKIKFKSRLTYIDPVAKTYVQRIYIDTRDYDGNGLINVQITPKYKREEKDTPGQAPETLKDGVKTAYRTTYEITNPSENADIKKKDFDTILKTYDISRSDMSMVNTARWRPFDWGFDEDQLNLGKGVYIIDVEGYYDDVIITGKSDKTPKYNIPQEDIGKIDLNLKFYAGAREFQQLYEKSTGDFSYKLIEKGSYQGGAAALRAWIEKTYGKDTADAWAKGYSTFNGVKNKYQNFIGKHVKIGTKDYYTGRVYPALNTPTLSKETRADLSPLYNSNASREIPKEGLTIVNDEEKFNITFSKHGKDKSSWDPGGKEVAENRLEGAIFKLQREIADGSNIYDDMAGKYVSSAFNGYFGFRGLIPGRYRLMEVKAPNGYRPINDPILYMTIKSSDKDITDPKTGKIIPAGSGYITLEYDKGNGIYQYDGATDSSGKLVDFVTSATAKNMGKIVNEKPGQGKVTIKKVDDKGNKLTGAEFTLTRKTAEKDGTGTEGQEKDGIYTGTIGADGTLVIDQLPIGQYTLKETKPAPGHLNEGTTWNFTVGGKDLDPYTGDIKATGNDLTSALTLDPKANSIEVEKYMTDDKTTDTKDTIHPHKAQSLAIKSRFTVNSGTTIKPGDFFKVDVSKNIDLEGIYAGKPVSLDIFADAVGTVAKGYYDKDKGEITYVFTDYAKTYTLLEFKTNLVAWINLNEVKDSGQQTVGISIKDKQDKVQSNNKKLNVKYDIPVETSTHSVYNYESGQYENLNITGKITKMSPNTGEFEQYYYINREAKDGPLPTFRYYPNNYNLYAIEGLDFKIYKLRDNTGNNIAKSMPESFAVNEEDPNLEEVRPLSYSSAYWLEYSFNENTTMTSKDSYIVKISGKINPQNTWSYRTSAELLYYGDIKAARYDSVYFDINTASAKTKLEITAVNPSNKIIFKKTGPDQRPLKDAFFRLDKLQEDNTWKGITDPKPTNENGIIEFTNLDKGKYRLIETTAPNGYEKLKKDGIDGFIMEFEVDEQGNIYKKTSDPKDSTKLISLPVGLEPINVVNYKPIEFIKIDSVDGKALEGAEFELYYKKTKEEAKYKKYEVDGKAVTAKSDKDGKFKLNLTEEGYYALKETKAPNKYMRPKEFAKEFEYINGEIKEKLTKGYIAKDNNATDNSTYMLAEKNKTIQSNDTAFNSYIVINPNHEKRTYNNDSSALLKYEGLGYYTMLAYRIDKDGNVSEMFTPDVTWSEGHDPKANLYKALGGEADGTTPIESTDTIVLKLIAVPDKVGEPVNIKVTIKDGSGEKEADYKFKQSDLPDALSKEDDPTKGHPKKTEDVKQEDYEFALEEYLRKYRTIQLSPIDVENNKGQYPSTGGMGTIAFTLGGVVLMSIAGILYYRKRRMTYE